jgi:3-hydroxyisobutyrate dehydrogenase-like beta-hydroxyacid dehydrogenase
MGSPIAANLLAAGHELTVYNRTEAKAELAFGLLAIAYEEPSQGRRQPINYPKLGLA